MHPDEAEANALENEWNRNMVQAAQQLNETVSVIHDPEANEELMRGHTQIEVMEALRPRFVESGFVGFEAPYGWLEIVVNLHEQLLDNPDYRIVQVKEKFGGLRFYTQGITEEQRPLVRAAEKESLTVCQGCGSREDVEMRNHGWVATLCADCNYDAHTSATARGYR